jgi:hypothetical protein
MATTIGTPTIKGSFDWLATVIYPLAVVLMEVFWVYPWLAWLGSWPMFTVSRPVLSLASVAITLAASLLVTRLTIRQKWPLWRMRSVIVGSGLVVILLVLAVDYRAGYGFLSGSWFGHIFQVLGNTFVSPQTIVIAIPALLYFWWRGINLGQATSYFRDIYRTFILGMVVLIILIIVWQISAASERFTGPGADIGWYIMAFFFFGLISIAVCHLYLMRSSMPREEARLTSVWRSLPIMLGVIVVVVLVGFGMASVFSPELFESIGHAFRTLGHWLGTAIGYILWPIIFVFEWLVRIFVWFINLLRGQPTEQEGQPGMPGMPEFPEQVSKELPLWATEAIKWVVVALVVALVLFILYKALSRIRGRRPRDEIEEIHESLWSWKGLRDDLKGLFKNLFKKREAAPAAYRFDEDVKGEMDIREIYRHLQWEGKRSGIPRRRHETASEYAGHLERSVPDSTVPVDDITRMYENVRYGERDAPGEQVHQANNLWQTLKAMLRKLRGD